jgi:pteridine reductase
MFVGSEEPKPFPLKINPTSRMQEITPQQLSGKTVLVTGAARRIGAAIVATLHDAGMRVAIHYRESAAEADQLAGELNASRNDSARAFQADLISPGNPERLIEEVVGWAGTLDVLVNNASTFYPTPLGEIDESAWTDLVGSNLKAPLFLSQAAARHLQESRGSIINIVDIHAQRPLRDHHVYGAAKAGLLMLTKSLAKELAPDIRVNAVAPGAIAWPENGMTETVKESILSEIPLGRSGNPVDIANAVLFLVRDATYSTGQVLKIDGGRSIGW